MSLTLPTTTELLRHMRRMSWDPSAPEELVAGDALQEAADMMEIASGLTADVVGDDRANRVIKRGIMAMAHALIVWGDDRETQYANYSSEHLGSYSYTKDMKAKALAGDTGVPEFDYAVGQVSVAGTTGLVSSEDVFSQPFAAYQVDQGVTTPDTVIRDVFGR